MRLFRINRILDLKILDQEFKRSLVLKPMDALRIPEEEYPQITLRFPKEMAYRVYDEFDKTQIQRQENGDLIASARMPADRWLTGFLLSLGAQVEILSPPYLKTILAEEARLIYEKNKP